MIFNRQAFLISKKRKRYSVYFKNPPKIVFWAFVFNTRPKPYYPHIIVAVGKPTPRLRSSLFYQ